MEVKQAGVQESSSGSSQGQDIGNNASESVMVCNILVEVIHFYYFPQVGSSDSAITDTSCISTQTITTGSGELSCLPTSAIAVSLGQASGATTSIYSSSLSSGLDADNLLRSMGDGLRTKQRTTMQEVSVMAESDEPT